MRERGAGRRAVLTAAVAAALLALSAALPAAAQAPSDGLPSDATIFLRGHGWGHARGMGQWGAKGMAADGKDVAAILTHYYSGVTIETRAPETIRVLVESSPDAVVTSDAPFTASWPGGQPAPTTAPAGGFLRATPTGAGVRLESGSSPTGPWTVAAEGAGPIVFSPGTEMLQLVFDAGSVRYYRGAIEVRRGSPSVVYAVNELPVEEYLYGVVPREMPATWEIEALKAQSVAARSYALNKKVRARARGAFYDICASSGCQVYGGAARKPAPGGTKVALERDATNRAVQATAGMVMTTGGTPVFAEFSSSTGGYSAPGSSPYLAAVPDTTDAISPHHNWSARIRVSSVEARWPSLGNLLSVRVTKRNGFGQWGGRVTEMVLAGTAGSATISGAAFRDAFTWPTSPDGVRSTWFVAYYWDAALVQAPGQVVVPSNGAVTVEIALKNVGNISWRVGSYVRLAAGSTRFADASWVSSSRPAAVSANQTDPGADRVRRGQVALFRFKLNANGATPGSYQETFRPIADGYTTMRPQIPVSITVTPG